MLGLLGEVELVEDHLADLVEGGEHAAQTQHQLDDAQNVADGAQIELGQVLDVQVLYLDGDAASVG